MVKGDESIELGLKKCYIAGSEDGEGVPWTKEYGQPLESRKCEEIVFPFEHLGGLQPC